jgi:hypothetical protein
MSVRRRAVGALVATLALLTGLVVAASPATADAATPLPFTHYGHVLADAHGHVYVTGGAGTNGIWVRNADGSANTTITNQAGASGMALSADGATLYVALHDAPAIVAIDTTTLAESARYATPSHCPDTLAILGATIWFASVCGSFDPVGVLTLADGTTAYSSQTFYQGLVLAVPSDPTSLLVGERSQSPTYVSRYTVSGSTLTLAASYTGSDPVYGSAANMQSMAIDPDGLHVVVASGAPYRHLKLLISDLSVTGDYPTDTYPDSVATTTALGGLVAAGVDGIYNPDIWIYAANGSLLKKYDFPDELVSDGLAFSPDGSRLYAITAPIGTPDFQFRVLDAPTKVTSTLTLTGPSSVPLSGHVALSGALTTPNGPVSGATVAISRTDASGVTALPDAVTGADGSFTVSDTAGTTALSYTATYAGNATNGPATATWNVAVTKIPSTLTIVAPSTSKRAVAYTVTATLTSDAVAVPGALVSVKRVDLAGTRLSSVRTNASGALSIRDVPAVGGPVTWTLSWPGDDTHAAVTSVKTVSIARAATALTLKVSSSVFSYGAKAVVTVHLGTTFNHRDVYIYARPLGAPAAAAPGRLIAHARVNRLGNVVVSYVMHSRTTFTARFLGDYRYGAAARASSPYVRAKVSLVLQGWSSRSGSTYIYRGVDPVQVITVSPNRAYQCFSVQVQALQGGRWGTLTTLSCSGLDASSHGYLVLQSNRAPGILIRIRAYVGSDTASQTLGATSPWVTLKFA